MADFTDREKDTLEKLAKAYEKAGHTDASRDPWEELYGRETTVNAERAAMAADVLQGWAGSWASSYNYGMANTISASLVNPAITIQSNDPLGTPVPVRAKTTKLGLRGVPDIDFVPFNVRTNRFGAKGPSLVGHPISYEVQGPTLKSPACDWTFEVRGGAGPNGGDLLLMSTRSDGATATCINVVEAYDVADFTIGGAAEPNGGLYLIITDDGTDPGSIPPARTPMVTAFGAEDTARYEIFRISNITTNVGSGIGEIELHPSKPLSNYFFLPTFTGPGDERFIRAVTMIKPYVTRLAAVANSGSPRTTNPLGNGLGRERSYLVVSPENAAASDLYPPFDGGTAGDGTWLQGGFTESGAPGSGTPIGSTATYMGRMPLPIPIPIREKFTAVERDVVPTPPVTPVGEWLTIDLAATAADAGLIYRVSQTERPDALPPPGLAYGKDQTTILGWWPILSFNAVPLGYNLGKVPEVDPETGIIYYGPGPYVQDAALTVSIGGTFHDPISRLWVGNFDADRTEASRIKNLIDPRYVARDAKRLGSVIPSGVQPLGSSSGRPDRSIFNTQTTVGGPIPEASNPGSFLDLGFRMVLFPSKDDGAGNAIPDYDKPITGRRLIIDPDVEEEQYVDIDYSGGIVRLSHPPPDRVDPDSNIVPNGWPGEGNPASNNERGEVVLWAACVPYSMEEGQLGTGNRVTAQNDLGRDIDVFSRQINASIDLTNTDLTTGVAPYVGPSTVAPFPVEIILDRIWEGPQTGVITINTGGLDGRSFGTWGYTETRQVTIGPNVVTALGGISANPFPVTIDPVPGAGEVRSVVLRRQVNFGLQSSGLTTTDDYELDTTYGSSARSNILRFENANLTYEQDGSTLIKIPGKDLLDQQWHQWGYISASGIPGAGTEELLSTIGVLAGVLYEDTGSPNGGGDSGQKQSFDDGQVHTYAAPPGDFTGFLTEEAQVRLEHVFRLVVKFEMTGDFTLPPDPDGTYFIGFGDPEPGGGTGSVADALTVPPPAGANLVGLRFDGLYLSPPVTEFEFFMQRGGGASLSIPTGVFPEAPPGPGPQRFYFAMETSRGSPIVKFRLYDENLQILAAHDQVDPLPLPLSTFNSEFTAGVQTNSANDVFNLDFYFASIVNRVDLEAPKI
jgi:hypothetical protein